MDKHSNSNFNDIKITHIDLSFEVDFNKQIIYAEVIYSYKLFNNTNVLILDIDNIDVKTIKSNETNKELAFKLNKDKYQYIELQLPENKEDRISLVYQTTAQCTGIQWLKPLQTTNKTQPALFTQSQPIYARSWLPCQDTPSVRFTYNATIQTKPELLALMSAENPQKKSQNGEYTFCMKQPIPSYLMAMAIGDFDFKAYNNQLGIYAEKTVLEKAYQEFDDVLNIFDAAQALYGKYLWDRFDVLIMPKSFPYGGMENPKLTFATPTLIAGDKSLINVIAHELAHSWSGNLVTNATWDDFWLNEGFTVYFERRILEELEGEDYADMHAVLGYKELLETIKHAPQTSLKTNTENQHPETIINAIPYEKGFLFLKMLEHHFGKKNLDEFLNSYFNHFAFKSVSTESFEAFIKNNLLSENEYQELQINDWLYKPDIPDNNKQPKSLKFELIDKQIKQYSANYDCLELKTHYWTAQEWVYFINHLPCELTVEQIISLDNYFKLTKTQNAEIAFAWYKLCIDKNYVIAAKHIAEFIENIGRKKFVFPLYKKMIETNYNNNMAQKVFNTAKQNYHNIVQNAIEQLFLQNKI